MNAKKALALLLALALVCALTACGAKDAGQTDKPDAGTAAAADGTKGAEEAAATYQELMEQENALFAENTELWDKVFLAADKNAAAQGDVKNYGDFLLATIESAKDQFTADELELLKDAATQISSIEDQLAELEEQYPELMSPPADGGMSVPADGTMQKFPAFEGKDLDGNDVTSDELFSGNAVTVVNFWFTTCSPCVGELSELDELNQKLAEQGGALIGINSFTLGGDEAAIAEAKDVLSKKNATYQNVYFDSDSEAGEFVENVFAFPTTYVVDRSGNIVGDPIVGAITEKSQMEALQTLIDKAIAADAG